MRRQRRRKKQKPQRNQDSRVKYRLKPDGLERIFDVLDVEVIAKLPIMAMLVAVKWPLSVIPELFMLLGQAKFIEFLNVFGGTELKVPELSEFNDIVREFEVFKEKILAPETADEYLKNKFELTQYEVHRIFSNFEALLGDVGILSSMKAKLLSEERRRSQHESD